MVKVSIIIPVYNAEKYLKKCLDSVINQTLKEIEIICTDDKSTDSSLSILREYAKKDCRIKILEQTINQGQGTARNRALEIATGEYIGFVDSDDWIEAKTYEQTYAIAKQYDIDLVCWGTNIVPEASTTNKTLIQETQNYQQVHLKGAFIWHDSMYSYIPCTLCNKLFKTSVIKNNNITFPENLKFEDEEFFAKYILFCNKFYSTDNAYYNYRLRDNSTMGKSYCENSSLCKLDCIDICKNLYIFYEKNSAIKEHKDLLNLIFNYLIGDCYKNIKNEKSVITKVKEFIGIIDNRILQNKDLQYISDNKINKVSFLNKNSLCENLFSIKNIKAKKQITIFGIKIKIKSKKNEELIKKQKAELENIFINNKIK